MTQRTTTDLLNQFLKQNLTFNVFDGSSEVFAGSAVYTVATANIETVFAYGKVTGPAADAAVATIASASLPTGLYEIVLKCMYTGSGAAAADVDNIDLRRQGTQIYRMLMPANIAASDYDTMTSQKLYYRFNGSQNLTVNAVGNATATVAYGAILTARFVRG